MDNRDSGISPVTGIILMVAITVILAAVIAAFVFGSVSGPIETKTVSVNVTNVTVIPGSFWRDDIYVVSFDNGDRISYGREALITKSMGQNFTKLVTSGPHQMVYERQTASIKWTLSNVFDG